jgi:hypothetical protein
MTKMIHHKWALLVLALLLIVHTASAQGVSADSIKALNNNTKMLRMAISINEQKVQLAKLQNQLVEQRAAVEKTAAASLEAARKNEAAAERLKKDDQDKSKAKEARRSAQAAETNSSEARDAQDKLERLTRDVQKLEKKIADNQEDLVKMGGAKYLQ